MLILSYGILCICSLALYSILNQPLFSKPPYFNSLYMMTLFVELAMWLGIFFLAAFGKKASRSLFNLGIAAEFLFAGWLVYDLFRHTSFFVFYLVWCALVLIKSFLLMWFKNWLFDSWFGRIYYDHVLFLPQEEQRRDQARARNARRAREQQARAASAQAHRQPSPTRPGAQTAVQPETRRSAPARSAGFQTNGAADYGSNSAQPQPSRTPLRNRPDPDFSSASPRSSQADWEAQERKTSRQTARSAQSSPDLQGNPDREEQLRLERQARARKALSSKYPRAAIRMAIGVYGELIVFPILVHLFQNRFVSIDNGSVFATGLMFTLCILTAALWTLPIFFYYLKYPGSKKSLYAALGGQLLILTYGLFILYRYWKSDTTVYPDSAFILFLIFELVRYAVLIIMVFPAFRLPNIYDPYRSRPASDEEENYDVSDEGVQFEIYEDDDPLDEENEEEEEDSEDADGPESDFAGRRSGRFRRR